MLAFLYRMVTIFQPSFVGKDLRELVASFDVL